LFILTGYGEIKLIENKKIDFRMRPEDELILCCARTKVNSEIKDKISSLVHEDLDWDYLLRMVSRHRLMPLFYSNLNSICPELVPENLLNRLQGNFYENVHKNLLLTGELIKVLNLLESKGITGVPYKGSVLALMAYDNMVLRQFGDIDLFIHEEDVLEAKKLLLSHNFSLCFEFNHINDNFYLKTQREYKLINNKTRTIVEIHWNFHGPFFYLPVEPDFLAENLKTVNINDFKISTFNPENLLLILCIHSAKHDWDRLGWICDISELIQNHKMDWMLIIRQANQLCIQRILLINLFLANYLLGLKVPDEIAGALNSDHSVEEILMLIIIKIFSETVNPLSLLNKTLSDFKKRENAYYGLKDCILGLTAPVYPDFESLHLPESLYSLYYILRPFNLLKRYKL